MKRLILLLRDNEDHTVLDRSISNRFENRHQNKTIGAVVRRSSIPQLRLFCFTIASSQVEGPST
jgi:hypothetical protein